MKLVDSSGWMQYFMNGPLIEAYVPYLKNLEDVCTPTVVLYEVYKKLKAHLGENQALWAVAQIKKTNIIPLTESIALKGSDVSLEYKLPMNDSLIYATALSTKSELVTSDSDFEKLPGVRYISHVER